LTGISSTQGFLPYKICANEQELQETIGLIRKSIDEAKTDFRKKQLQQVITHLESDKSANLQMVFVAASGSMDGIEDQTKLFPPVVGQPHGVTAVMCAEYPASRGSIHIKSSNVNDPPVIDPGYAKDPADIAFLAGAYRMLDRMFKSDKIAPFLENRTFPPPNVDLQDLSQAKQVCAEYAMGEYHACGSVAMGAALDSRLKVKGTKNIRTIDASVMSNNVSGNICSSVYALAEKAADLIKEDSG